MKRLVAFSMGILLLAGTASIALAYGNYDFEGDGGGWCGGLDPWQPWQGTVYAAQGEPFYFQGYWGNDPANIIFGYIDAVSAMDTCFAVSEGIWLYNNNQVGYWSGFFCVGSDTAWGNWWSADTCRGRFWGNLAY